MAWRDASKILVFSTIIISGVSGCATHRAVDLSLNSDVAAPLEHWSSRIQPGKYVIVTTDSAAVYRGQVVRFDDDCLVLDQDNGTGAPLVWIHSEALRRVDVLASDKAHANSTMAAIVLGTASLIYIGHQIIPSGLR